jgi:transmembrane protein EpsG
MYTTDLYYRDPKQAKKRYVQIVCVILVLVSGLRNVGVGEDTYNYYLDYHRTSNVPWQDLLSDLLSRYRSGEEIGYPIFVKATQFISENFTVYLLIVAALFYLSLGKFINSNTPSLASAILALTIFYVLFFYVFSMTAIRQSLAMAATMICYEFIKRKKLIPYILILILASTIHKSILIFLPFYFICRLKNTKFIFPLVLILFPIIMVLRSTVGVFIINFGGYEVYDQYEGAGTFTFTTIFLFVSAAALFRQKLILQNSPGNIHYYHAFAFALVLLPLSWISPVLLRVTMYFSIFMILLIPQLIASYKTFSVAFPKHLLRAAILVLFLMYSRTVYTKEYRFFWEEVKLGENYE